MYVADDDHVVGMVPVTEDGELLVISEKGMGKRSSVEEYRQQNRGGKGLITYKVTEKTGPLIGCTLVDDEKDLLIITDTGMIIRVSASEIPTLSRATSGVKLMRSNGASIVDFTLTDHEEPEEIFEENAAEASEEISDQADADNSKENDKDDA